MAKVIYPKQFLKERIKDLPECILITYWLEHDVSGEPYYEYELDEEHLKFLESTKGRKLMKDLWWSGLKDMWDGDPARLVELEELIDGWANES